MNANIREWARMREVNENNQRTDFDKICWAADRGNP